MAFGLSEGERQYIISGIKEDVRADGRGCKHVRHFSLRTGVASNTSGSALIEREGTSAIIGVKAELGLPRPSTPDQGRLEFSVDCSGLAGPMFERRGGELLGQRLAEQLEETYASQSCVDCKALSIIKGEQCWILYVDALMLSVGGNVLDTLSLGVRAALHSTLVPQLTVSGEGDEMEIEVSDNPHDSTPVSAEGAPIIITLNQIGGHYVVDCTQEEELCSSCHISLAVDKEGNVLSTSMSGAGAVPYNQINDVIKVGLDVAGELFASIDTVLTPSNQSLFT